LKYFHKNSGSGSADANFSRLKIKQYLKSISKFHIKSVTFIEIWFMIKIKGRRKIGVKSQEHFCPFILYLTLLTSAE
jgi:hypothetical protein